MDELLVPLKTTKAQSDPRSNVEYYPSDPKQESFKSGHGEITSAEHALEILRCRPQQEDFCAVLQWLHPHNSGSTGFDIHSQTLQASQIIHTLINDVLPDYWDIFWREHSEVNRRMRDTIILILSNVSGLSILNSRLKALISGKETSGGNQSVRDSAQAETLKNTMSLLESILEPQNFVRSIWSRLCRSSNSARRWLLWKELVTLLGNGRILSTASEADAILQKSSDSIKERSKLSDGNQTVEATFEGMLYGTDDLSPYISFVRSLKGSVKKIAVYSLLRNFATILTGPSSDGAAFEENPRHPIGNIAALFRGFAEDDKDFANLLIEWLSSDGIVQDLRPRRAVIAALAEDLDTLKSTVTESLRTFGDKLYIKHAPVLHQEGMTENLLLLIGYTHRKIPLYVAEMARSSPYLNSISNRLAAASHRVSLLGMYLGTAMSRLVDPLEKRMNFGSEEMISPQGQRYLSLTDIQDPLGSTDNLRRKEVKSEMSIRAVETSAIRDNKPKEGNGKVSTGSKIISIEEVGDETEPEDEDLPLYAKPDSDASDSDEDPTVIERNKPTAPVYIDDLISGLRDTENYARHLLALTNASSLIRRKAAFGTEVSDNAEDLANILTGLGDKWNIEDFQELRLQGMIAVLVAQPLEMGQWFSRTYFNGDYSIQQRATILTTLGLGARELAGYGKEDMALTKSNPPRTAPFPSKQLPPKLHALYASNEKPPLPDIPGANAVHNASQTLQKSILQPMAFQAADALSGPNALKVRTFSSRMEVEKRRTKPIANAMAKVVADGFFFPLTGRWGMHVQGHARNSPLLETPLLPLFLKTLALILHASGPSTLPLPLMTSEFLSLILSLRSHSRGSLPVTEALLFAFLTVLEVNGASDQGRRLAAENGKALLEMGEWVEGVLGRVLGEGEEEGRVKGLAAGCVGRVREVVEREERVLVGELAGLM
ncbi:MAG: hypothetical protein Q9192_002554 [Flavoplaca navasiana]